MTSDWCRVIEFRFRGVDFAYGYFIYASVILWALALRFNWRNNWVCLASNL